MKYKREVQNDAYFERKGYETQDGTKRDPKQRLNRVIPEDSILPFYDTLIGMHFLFETVHQ